MRVLGHTAISVIIGGISYNHTRSLSGFLWVLTAGILIDMDHYIDYIRNRGFSFNIKKVHNTCRYGYLNFKKITLILHSYELLILLWVSIFIFGLNSIWKYAAIGFTAHLFLDQIFNPVRPFGYFLAFRIANNFETKKLFLEKEGDNLCA